MSMLLAICFFACSIVCWLHVRKIVADKAVKGVSIIPSFVFITTNAVEVVYFAERFDMWSAAGAASMLLSNLVWVGCVIYYMAIEADRKFDADLDEAMTRGLASLC